MYRRCGGPLYCLVLCCTAQVEQYVDDMKNGRSDESRLVDQLSHRVGAKTVA